MSREEERDSPSCAIPLRVEPVNQKNGLCSDFTQPQWSISLGWFKIFWPRLPTVYIYIYTHREETLNHLSSFGSSKGKKKQPTNLYFRHLEWESSLKAWRTTVNYPQIGETMPLSNEEPLTAVGFSCPLPAPPASAEPQVKKGGSVRGVQGVER